MDEAIDVAHADAAQKAGQLLDKYMNESQQSSHTLYLSKLQKNDAAKHTIFL